jgi:hypothetical protein
MHSSVVAIASGLTAFVITGYLLIRVWMRKAPKAEPAPAPRPAHHKVPSWREYPRNVDGANAAKARQWWKNPK